MRWQVLAAVATALLSGCGTVALPSPAETAPLFRRIDARVGTVYTAAARETIIATPVLRIEVGKTSVARFEQAFAAMFSEAVELPDWPPWREGVIGVNGVIELERADVDLALGNDTNRPDVVSASFRVCLYEPNGATVRCWSPSVQLRHQRGLFECLDHRSCFVPMTEAAIREATARFLVEAESDPALREWAGRIGR